MKPEVYAESMLRQAVSKEEKQIRTLVKGKKHTKLQHCSSEGLPLLAIDVIIELTAIVYQLLIG